MKILYTLLLPLFMVLSCGNSKKSVTPQQDMKNSIGYTVILKGVYGGLENNEQRVIKSDEDLEEVYGIINRFRKPGLPTPDVDFSKHIVVALFMGEKMSGGFSTEVQSVSIAEDKMVVNVIENGPKPTDMVTMAICQPFCIVKIPRPEEGKKVVFEKI